MLDLRDNKSSLVGRLGTYMRHRKVQNKLIRRAWNSVRFIPLREWVERFSGLSGSKWPKKTADFVSFDLAFRTSLWIVLDLTLRPKLTLTVILIQLVSCVRASSQSLSNFGAKPEDWHKSRSNDTNLTYAFDIECLSSDGDWKVLGLGRSLTWTPLVNLNSRLIKRAERLNLNDFLCA